jgi:plastocyanin
MTPRWLTVAVVLIVAALPAARAADLAVRVLDSAGRPLPEAVVYLRGPAAGSAPPPGTATIDQKNKQFVPRVTVIPVGTVVTFPNSDQIRHSVYSFSPAKSFTIKLYAGKPQSPVVFDHEGVVVLGCNIHDQMAAWVVVVDTPILGKTDSTGSVIFRGVRQASYELNAWYPGMESGPLVQAVLAGSQDLAPRDVRLPVDGPGSLAQ